MNKNPTKRTRVSVTMTQPYVDALDKLVAQGLYLNRGEIVLDALRQYFRTRRIELPYQTETE